MTDSDRALYSRIENEEQFWSGLEEVVLLPADWPEDCDEQEGLIDDALRSFLGITDTFKKEYLQSEREIARCCYVLLNAPRFVGHGGYVRRQMLYCLLQDDDDFHTLHIAAAVLLYEGRKNEQVFTMMQNEGAFPRLVELVRSGVDDELGLHRVLLKLLSEMSRIQKLTRDDLATVDDTFVTHLFDLIEQFSDDASDPYHYPIIRVLLVLNEQYMCLANMHSESSEEVAPLKNRILKLLSMQAHCYRTFAHNIILLFNRESELSSQLLILKLLYLLFTTPSTYEYFYTNDLYVIVDVIIRNLLDLDPGGNVDDNRFEQDGSEKDVHRALRHTYLRVLWPLLKNTQLSQEGSHYKRNEVRRLLFLLANRSFAHFAPVDETVIRLVVRCRQIEWLREAGDEEDEAMNNKLHELVSTVAAPTGADVAKKMLGMSIKEASVSALSVDQLSAVTEKEHPVAKSRPNVPPPRRQKVLSSRMVSAAAKVAEAKEVNGSHTDSSTFLAPPARSPLTDGEEVASPSSRLSPFADENEEQ